MIAQLGADNPGRDHAERTAFNNGLKDLITTLRKDNVNEPKAVVDCIRQYRRAFVNDPSSVLNL
jgi:hypothetical protein